MKWQKDKILNKNCKRREKLPLFVVGSIHNISAGLTNNFALKNFAQFSLRFLIGPIF